MTLQTTSRHLGLNAQSIPDYAIRQRFYATENLMPTFDLTKLLNPKNWLYFALLVVVAWAGLKGFNWIHDRGYNKKAKEVKEQIATLTGERDTAVNGYNTYKGEYDTWVNTTKAAQEQFLADQIIELAAAQERLEAAEKLARNKPVTIKEVIKYVPAEVDAVYRLPTGFVSLYNDTLQGKPTANSGTSVPGSFTGNVGEASSLALSQFGQIAAFNNAECVVRGKVIDEWQLWYLRVKPQFDNFQRWQRENAPKEQVVIAPPQ